MIKFSEDYKGPLFGFATKAREFDKWAHFAGSAAWMRLLHIFAPSVSLWSFFWVVVTFGLALEFLQGREAYVDPKATDGFSWVDMCANVFGALLGVAA